MKRQSILLTFILIFGTALVFYACQKSTATKENVQSNSVSQEYFNKNCPMDLTVPLWAGQTIKVGTVTASKQGSDVLITYKTTKGWHLQEVHMNIVCNEGGKDACRVDNPKDLAPGQFPYGEEFSTKDVNCNNISDLPQEYSFKIPAKDFHECPTLCFCAYLHAAVVKCEDGDIKEETAWAGYELIKDVNRWYYVVSHCFDCL